LAKKKRYSSSNRSHSFSLGKTLRKTVIYLLLGFTVSSIVLCLLLRWLPPPTSAFMLYRHAEDLLDNGSFKAIDYTWVSKNKISPHAFVAVVASEDQRFFQHSGFDLRAIQSSIDDYMDGGKLRGASTISQQVAKNLFLTPARSFFRKAVEAWFTFLIETLWTKDRILLVYLNIAEFGDHLFGVEAASRHYFGIPAKRINRHQAALLAASLPNPIVLKISRPSNYLMKRHYWILRQMQNIGYNPASGKR
jgi:monofunctional glycosyltransferase